MVVFEGVPDISAMADLYQSSLLEPTAPPEYLLQRRATKNSPKVVSGKESNDKEKTPASSTSSRTGHSLTPLFNYFTKRRKINNNNNNNNNNDNKFSHDHSSQAAVTLRDNSHSRQVVSGGKRFAFFRSKQTSEPPSVRDSTEGTAASERKDTASSQKSQFDTKQPESLEPQAKDEMEVLCHGLMEKTESFSKKCLLSHSGHETDSDSESVVSEKRSNQMQFDETDKCAGVSVMQEQLNSINLKRCMDATMPQSIGSTTLPAHSESLSIPPVIEEIEEASVDEPPVIEVILPQREPAVKSSSGIQPMQSMDGNISVHNNVKKRRKLRHILRHFLNMNSSFVKEDKQRLVEDEEEDDEEEEHEMVETAIDEQECQGDNTCPVSKTPLTQDGTDAVTPEKKRQPGTKGHCRGWGHRVRRSLGRGCHYLGLSVLNITNYIVAEATFMGSVNTSRNYDWDYIYNTNEYGVKDYMYD
ncbi:putative uncharacterized protein DDB_G0292292 isoform X2 [Portunus trituberculatus]|uniref:putative uncharacterized protein DDB_G0292292 isoform X2 n=1 Tax=Portunus trituberculatus TaxID=210409 RepID=UPI001E1CF118|nr:putative uncharacterized protein DDB_G0292292 isoform X2 [Portunus trituberculatus]